jgi:hypothetical protein
MRKGEIKDWNEPQPQWLLNYFSAAKADASAIGGFYRKNPNEMMQKIIRGEKVGDAEQAWYLAGAWARELQWAMEALVSATDGKTGTRSTKAIAILRAIALADGGYMFDPSNPSEVVANPNGPKTYRGISAVPVKIRKKRRPIKPLFTSGIK